MQIIMVEIFIKATLYKVKKNLTPKRFFSKFHLKN